MLIKDKSEYTGEEREGNESYISDTESFQLRIQLNAYYMSVVQIIHICVAPQSLSFLSIFGVMQLKPLGTNAFLS